jgi:hypothetical protein
LANIDVSDNSLSGSIPPALFLLPVLQKLAIISNQLTGEIPNNIGQSTGLVRLRLSNNSLSGMYVPTCSSCCCPSEDRSLGAKSPSFFHAICLEETFLGLPCGTGHHEKHFNFLPPQCKYEIGLFHNGKSLQ